MLPIIRVILSVCYRSTVIWRKANVISTSSSGMKCAGLFLLQSWN